MLMRIFKPLQETLALLLFRVSGASAPQGGVNPTWPLVGTLCATVMAPFFAVAAASPLLQQWFAGLRHRRAADPYFLYAASNAGSLLGLAFQIVVSTWRRSSAIWRRPPRSSHGSRLTKPSVTTTSRRAKTSSQWVILSRFEDDFGPLIEDVRWQVLAPDAALPVRTDHYTSLWGIVRW